MIEKNPYQRKRPKAMVRGSIPFSAKGIKKDKPQRAPLISPIKSARCSLFLNKKTFIPLNFSKSLNNPVMNFRP